MALQFGTVADWVVGLGTLVLAFLAFWSAKKAGEAAVAAAQLASIEAERRTEERERAGRADVRVTAELVEGEPTLALTNLGPAGAENVSMVVTDPGGQYVALDPSALPISLLLPGHSYPVSPGFGVLLPRRSTVVVRWSDGDGAQERALPVTIHPPREHVNAVSVEIVHRVDEVSAELGQQSSVVVEVRNNGRRPTRRVFVGAGTSTAFTASVQVEDIEGGGARVCSGLSIYPEGQPWARVDFMDSRGYSWSVLSTGQVLPQD